MLLATGAQAGTATALQGWGYDDGQFAFPSDVSQFTRIQFGMSSAAALKSDGTVVAWGQNYQGECNVPAGLTNVTDIGMGDYFGLALKADGTVAAWGWDYYGQISSATGLTDVKAISAKGDGWMALKNDGTVAAFGYPYGGRLDVPDGLSNVKAIACGYYHCLALKEDGTIVGWGENYSGECDVPAGLTDVVALSAGVSYSVALKNDGTVVAWGRNYEGECNVPAGLSGVVSISAGGTHVMALKQDGTVVTWGSNDYGETTPKPDVNGIISISAGYGYSAALIYKPFGISTTRTSFYSGSTTYVKGTATFLSDSAAPRTLTLTSSDPSAVAVPTSVVVPGGAKSATFSLTHYPVADAKTVTITGTCAEGSFTVKLSLLPIAVKTIAFDLNYAEGGGSFNGVVTLNAAPREKISVSLSGDAPGLLFLNPTVNVAANNTTAYFPVTTQIVPNNTTVHVTAQAAGAPKTVPLTILAGPTVKSFKLSKSSIYGNQKVIGTVTLAFPARAGGTTVYVSVDPSGCSFPATVTVPEGGSTASFEIVGNDVSALTACTVHASTAYSSVGASLTVKPNLLVSLDLSSNFLSSGETATATVTLRASVEVDTVVDISIPGTYASAPTTLIILAGSNSGTATVTANPTTRTKTARVDASRFGLVKHQTITINP